MTLWHAPSNRHARPWSLPRSFVLPAPKHLVELLAEDLEHFPVEVVVFDGEVGDGAVVVHHHLQDVGVVMFDVSGMVGDVRVALVVQLRHEGNLHLLPVFTFELCHQVPVVDPDFRIFLCHVLASSVWSVPYWAHVRPSTVAW